MSILLIHVLLALFTALTAGTHIMTGHVEYGGDLDTSDGTQPYWCEADVKMPLLAWEDICPDECTDVKILFCNNRRITLSGNLDVEDFAPGVVMSFPDDEYAARGCPPAPRMIAGGKPDEVIFRKILAVMFGKRGRVTVVTKFVSGATVVPDIKIHVGEAGPSTVRLLGTARAEGDTGDMQLNTSARVGAFGFNGFTRSGAFALAPASRTTLAYKISISAGVCDLDFRRYSPRARWVTRLDAEAEFRLKTAGAYRRRKVGNLLRVRVPNLSFVKKIRLVGTIRMGLYVHLNYDSRIALSASTNLIVKGSYKLAHRFTLKVTDVNVNKVSGQGLVAVGRARTNGAPSAQARITGLFGIRPAVAVVAALPILPDASADIGATVGVRASIVGRTTPFAPLRSGRRIGVCGRCHLLRGPLSFVGVSFGSYVKVPFLGTKLYVVDGEVFRKRLGTACLFPATCPA